jgi:hypothetical protein
VANFHDKLQSFSTSWMVGDDLTAGWWGTIFALQWDQVIESWSIAARMHLLDDPENPDDALELIGRERRLPKYFLESHDGHRARLKDAWNSYEFGGTAEAIERQLALTGSVPTLLIGEWGNAQPDILWGDEPDAIWGDRTAVVVFNLSASGPRGESPPYYSQFWIRFAYGFHPVTGPALPFDGTIWAWGDTGDGIWGPVGYSPEYAAMWLAIVKKWRPNGWIFRGFIFDMGLELLWGDADPDFDWGDNPDFVWGGAITVPMIT